MRPRVVVARAAVLETALVKDVEPDARPPRAIEREFRTLLGAGFALRCCGAAAADPTLLLRRYTPKHAIALFDAVFYLTNLREDENFRFFVAYVRLGARRALYPRIFYKDSSLVWRSPSHYVRSEHENWIGKGDLKPFVEDGDVVLYAAEETTNLPFELQQALDVASRRAAGVRRDLRAVPLVLRKARDDRVEPYADFSAPRRRAMRVRRNLVNGGRPVARFDRPGDPASLEFVAGYEPDFEAGVVETSASKSRLYGGDVHKFRILSTNRRVQWQFVAGPRHAWVVPPQTLTTELSSYGVRTVDVNVDEDLCVPGYEYHFLDDTEAPPRFYSQIPAGFAGPQSDVDPSRADASPWLEKLPVIQAFRARVLRRSAPG
ncbi:MAG TPA: hypothetical protein VHQ66_03030 [Myxococcota bacterium]|nr:hypothetical protein [Myxococcota bacterium]